MIVTFAMLPHQLLDDLEQGNGRYDRLDDDDVPKLGGMSQIGLKLHPGAEKFWKEKGLAIPANISTMK